MHRSLFLVLIVLSSVSILAAPSQTESDGVHHFVLEPAHALGAADLAALESEGITVQRAIGGNRYLVRVRDTAEVAGELRIRSLRAYDAGEKVSSAAYAEAARGGAFTRLTVLFHDDVNIDDARAAVEDAGGTMESPLAVAFDVPRLLTVRIPAGALQTLAHDDRVFGVYGRPLRPKSVNAMAAQLSRVTPLFSAPYNLSGAGVVMSIFELATAVTSHPDFGGRYIAHFNAGQSISLYVLHATHVSGTIIGSGQGDPAAKGMVPAATLHEFNVIQAYSNMLRDKDTQVTALHAVSDNNSWDFSLGWQQDPSAGLTWNYGEDYYGAYDAIYSTPYDAIAIKSGAALFVHAAGNDAQNGLVFLSGFAPHKHTDEKGDTITSETFCYSQNGSGTDCPASECTPGNSAVNIGEHHCETTRHPTYGPFTTVGIEASVKNVLTVGAVDVNGHIGDFSSRGPALDGRIKPELVAKGINQFSTAGGRGYQTLSGTSMSTPVVTGIAGLLTEQWRKTFNGQSPTAVILKTLLIAGADDGIASEDAPGPDYVYGFGLVDAKSSVDLIIADAGTGAHIRTGSLKTGETVEYPLTVAAPQNVRVTLGWFDPDILPPPDERALPALLNDLDVKVIDPAGNTVLPYVLDGAHPTALAIRGVNTVDTTEMLEIKNAAAGRYRVIVSAKIGDTRNPSQTFVLVSNAALTEGPPPCTDAYEPNDTEATAYKFLLTGETISARICSATDLDFYQISAGRAGPLSVVVAAADTPLRVTLSGNGLTAVVADVATHSTRTLSAAASPGIYTVKVEPTAALGFDSSYTLLPSFSTLRRRATQH